MMSWQEMKGLLSKGGKCYVTIATYNSSTLSGSSLMGAIYSAMHSPNPFQWAEMCISHSLMKITSANDVPFISTLAPVYAIPSGMKAKFSVFLGSSAGWNIHAGI